MSLVDGWTEKERNKMGLEIRSKESKIKIKCGYIGFMWLRMGVATAYDKELGEHYCQPEAFLSEEGWEAYEKKKEEILNSERLKNKDKSVVNFLYTSDCEGKIDYKTCGKVYELIKDIENNEIPNWETLKQLLKDCYSYKSNLIWN